ncbi:MAG: potassium channel family protein [Acidimicrobiales bacterium]
MHIIIVGCGRVGSGLATGLVKEGHSVVVLDKQPGSFRRLPQDFAGQKVVGFGFDRGHLELAGAKRADALAAVTSGDNSNILTARIARETYEIPNVVARIYDPRRAEIFQRLGIPTVPSASWTIDQVFRRIVPSVRSFEWSDSSGHVHLVERVLPLSWAGRGIVSALGECDARLVAVTRAGLPTIEVFELVGQEGDMLHLMVYDESVERLEALFAAAEKVPAQ